MLTALTIGLFGSLHCLGMCGPLVMAMPFRDAEGQWRIGSVMAYHGGRLLSYAALGTAMGLIGGGLRLFFLQQWISIISGLLLLVVYFLPKVLKRFDFQIISSSWNKHIVMNMRQLLQPGSQSAQVPKMFSLGVMNGLLPCGLVYMALIGAVAQPSVWQASVFMMVFGLGTSPALTALILARKSLFKKVKASYGRAIPVFVAMVSLLLILRGLGLGIPYISPANESSCCHKPTSYHQEELPATGTAVSDVYHWAGAGAEMPDIRK